jgi:DNA-binding PadR family transcriptional regulator
LRKSKKESLTTADLVLLSLLAEKPMHGYQANAELERREIRDWAAISRPQVYYSMEKLARLGMLREAKRSGESGGPEKQSFTVTKAGIAALASALEREDWCVQREKPVFLTWMALSWQARKGVFERQLRTRQEFLERELARERETLRSVLEEVGHPYHEAVWMVKLMVAQLETELRWIGELRREKGRRGKAKFPALV